MNRIVSQAAILLFLMQPLIVCAVEPSDIRRTQPSPPPKLQNVQLTSDHRLLMEVVNSAGEPLPDIPVIVTARAQQQHFISDANGELTAEIPVGGTVVIQIHGDVYACRAWSAGTAPPGSVSRLAIVDQQQPVIRANRQSNNCCPPERAAQRLDRGYGLAVLALGSTAAYFALSRDNASD